MKIFGEDKKYVHLMSALNAEYSACGQAFDLGLTETEEDEINTGEIKPTDKKIVTCPDCIRVIEYCRGVHLLRTRKETK